MIGVEDGSKDIKGLDRDLKLMSDGKHNFELQVNREISNRLGHMVASVYSEVEFEPVDGEEVCVVWVDPSPKPIYFDGEDGEQFYVRFGSSAEPLTMQEAQEYIDRHFT